MRSLFVTENDQKTIVQRTTVMKQRNTIGDKMLALQRDNPTWISRIINGFPSTVRYDS